MRAEHGVVLAGGNASRLPGKPLAELDGRPLVSHVITAMRGAGLAVTVVGKPGTGDLAEVAEAEGAAFLTEPVQPIHALFGIATALKTFDAPIVVCAVDMPFVPPALLARLAEGPGEGRDALVCAVRGQLQPMLGWYAPGLATGFTRAVHDGVSATGALLALGGRMAWLGDRQLQDFGDPAVMLADIDTADELRRANA